MGLVAMVRIEEILPDAFIEQRRLIDKEAITIFDVGAHFGSITARYRELFPEATVYAFEQFPDSFSKLP